MTTLMQVRGNGCVLYFPQTFQHPELLRGGRGYVVDLDAPCEREWCKGQEYKLEPAPAGAKPTPIVHRVAKDLILAAIAKDPSPAAIAKPEPVKVDAPKPAVPTDDDLDESKRASRKPAKAGAA